jgi:hypothetical protein
LVFPSGRVFTARVVSEGGYCENSTITAGQTTHYCLL